MATILPFTRIQLIQCCTEQGIRGVAGKKKADLLALLSLWEKMEQGQKQGINETDVHETDVKEIDVQEEKGIETGENFPMDDTYTEDILRMRYTLHTNYVRESMEISKQTGIHFRLPCIPEDISENLIKFALHRTHDPTSRWNTKKSGDLFSLREGKQECKCFTSAGPISFTPSSDWDVIYFLDATQWIEDHFVLYRVPLRMSSPEWKAIKINKTQTYADQSAQGRRPRIGWSYLYPQLGGHCEKIAEGPFEHLLCDKTEV